MSFNKKQYPELWVTKPILYPHVISKFRLIKNTIIRYNKKKVVLLTGTEEKVGVSTVSFNLAWTCGWDMPERKILLIDANMSTPALHIPFCIDLVPGLLDFLYGNCCLEKIIRKSSIENLELIPLGKSYQNMPSPFTRKSFSNFMKFAIKKYDLIFIDSEPIISSEYTQSLLAYTGGVISIVELGKSRIETIKDIYTIIRNHDVHFIGTFLNRQRNIIPRWLAKYI